MLMATVVMMVMMFLPSRILVDAESMPSASSPSKSLLQVRFHKFLVSLCAGSLIRLHGVELFDKAKPPTPDMGIDTSRSCPYVCLSKSLVFAFSMALLQGACINIQYTSVASDLHFILQK
jgi:hypothetical protein